MTVPPDIRVGVAQGGAGMVIQKLDVGAATRIETLESGKADKADLELHVEDAGAVAGTDSLVAIQAALTALGSAGGGTLRGTPGKFYKTTNGTSLTQPSNVRIAGLGLDVSGWTSAGTVLVPAGTLGAGTALTVDAAEGDTTLTAAAWPGLAAGDHIRIESTVLFGTTSQPSGERQRVKTVAGTTLTLYSPLRDGYAVAATALVKKISDVVDPVYEDLHILGPTDITVAVQGIVATLCRGLSVKPGCVFERTHQRAIGMVDVLGGSVANPYFTSVEQAGFAYCTSLAGACEGIVLDGYRVERARHGVTVGGGSSFPGIPRNVTISDIEGKDMMDALVDCHPAGEDINVSSGQIEGGEVDGFVFQGVSGTWEELYARNVARHGLLIQPSTIKPLDFRATGRFRKCGSRAVQVSAVTGKETWARLDLDVDMDGCLRGVDLANATPTRWNGVSIEFSARNIAGHNVILQKTGRVRVVNKDSEVSTASTASVYLTDAIRGEITGGEITGSNTSSTRCVRLESCDHVNVHDIDGTGCQFGVSADNACTNCRVHDNDMTANTTPFSPGTGLGHVFHDNKPGETTQTLATDVNFTLTPFSSPDTTLHTGTLTANRTVTLSVTNAYESMEFALTRTGGGAFTLTFAGKALTTGQWAVAKFLGGAWVLTRFGSL